MNTDIKVPTLEDTCKVKRRGKGRRRRSNIFSKWLARRAAKRDLEKEYGNKLVPDEKLGN